MGRKFWSYEQTMKTIALEFDNRDMMVIYLVLFCRGEIIFEAIFWIAVFLKQVLDKAFPR